MKKDADTLTSKPMPFADLYSESLEEWEKGLLLVALQYPESLATSDLTGDCFRSRRMGEAFDTIRLAVASGLPSLRPFVPGGGGRGPDALAALFQTGWSARELAALDSSYLPPSLAPYVADRIREAHEVRTYQEELHAELTDFAADPESTPISVRIQALQDRIGSLKTAHTEKIVSMKDALAALWVELQTGSAILPTGWSRLDAELKGWPLGTLSILAGRPGMGKSAFAINACLKQALAGVPALYIGLEDRKEEHFRRVLSVQSKVPLDQISHEWIASVHSGESDTMAQITDAANELVALPLYFAEGPLLTSEILDLVTASIQRNQVRFVVVDHAQEIGIDEADQSDHRAYEIENAAKKLRDLAVRNNVAVVLCSQINRQVEQRAEKKPVLSDLRDSGALEMIARLVLLLYRDEYYNENSDRKGVLEVAIAKQNHGKSGGAPIELAWIGERCEVADLSYR